ncbi:hypothetical protein CIP100294_02294 [Corynebacterium diphtheriae]|nr:hypothetical protein CIP100294_02294 [Corynebacterium diphtheriae]
MPASPYALLVNLGQKSERINDCRAKKSRAKTTESPCSQTLSYGVGFVRGRNGELCRPTKLPDFSGDDVHG